jgi:hypothetical protein
MSVPSSLSRIERVALRAGWGGEVSRESASDLGRDLIQRVARDYGNLLPAGKFRYRFEILKCRRKSDLSAASGAAPRGYRLILSEVRSIWQRGSKYGIISA